MIITGTRVRGGKYYGGTASAAVTDSYFNLVALLLPGNGTNGAQNNTFLDSSTNNFTVTRNGNASQGTFSPFSQTGWSNYFDGSVDYLSVPHNSSLSPTGDFTIEFWAYTGSTGTQEWVTKGYGIQIYSSSSNWYAAFSSSNNTTYFLNSSFGAQSTNTWQHIAVSRQGNTYRGFVNGVATTLGTSSSSPSTGTDSLFVGAIGVGGTPYYATGYLSNLRIVDGTAVYTSTFTPPTAPLTAISGTSLLTCQSNRFIDNSANAFAITVTGNTSALAFAPFNPTTAYSASTVGGSFYFDGTGDYLSVADNAALDMGSSNFTIEAWIYMGESDNYTIYAKRATTAVYGGILFYIDSSGGPVVYATFNGSTWGLAMGGYSKTCNLYSWNHVALTRSGSTWTTWVNGVAAQTGTNSGTVPDNTAAMTIMAGAANGAFVGGPGYLSSWRLVKGTAVYTSTFTPPTAPLTAIANTSCLLNYTNAGITDAAAKNVLETVGSAQISTTRSKFGSSSIYLSSANDYLNIRASDLFAVYAGDFTVECWVNYAALPSGYTFIFSTYDGTNELSLRTGDSGFSYVVQAVLGSGAGAVYTSSYTRSDLQNVWTHLAFCRTGTTARFFYNGVLQSSKTSSVSVGIPSAGYPTVGYPAYSPTAYIQDLRFTKGVGRYTANFTPPATAFPTQ